MWKRLSSLLAEVLPGWVRAKALRRYRRARPPADDGGSMADARPDHPGRSLP